MKKVSAILCHHKGTLIDKAIESLRKSLEVELEIIVMTTGSENLERLKNKYRDIQVVDIQGGPAKKRNVGTRYAKHDLFAFFDDDVEVLPYTVFYMCQELDKPDVGAVFGKLLNMEFHDRLDEAGSFLTWSGFLYARCESGIQDVGQFEETVPILAGKSASMLVSRKVLWGAGGFDVSFEILGEETDLAWRIWLLGKKVMYCPRSVTYHAFNTRFKPADFYVPRRVYFNGSRNYMSMLITSMSVPYLIVPLITQACVWFLASVGFFLTGKHEAGLNILKGFAYLAVNFKAILQKRKLVQGSRVVPDSILLPTITHNPPPSYYLKRFVSYIRTGRHG